MDIIRIFELIFIFTGILIPGTVIANMFMARDEDGKVEEPTGFFAALGFAVAAVIAAASMTKLAEAAITNKGLGVVIVGIYLLAIAAFVGLAILWQLQGSTVGELICTLIVAGAIYRLAAIAAWAMCVLTISAFWQSVFKWLPLAALVATAGMILASFFYFLYKEMKKGVWAKVLYIIVLVITGLILASTLLMINWAAAGSNLLADNDTDTSNVIEEEEPELTAEDLENFTVPVLTAEELEELTLTKYASISEEFLDSSFSTKDKGRTAETGFSDALTFPFGTPDRFAELEEEILRNPVYGVTVVEALKDKKLGTETIGKLNPWMDKMVLKTDRFGMTAWLDYREGEDKIFVTKEYRIYAATLCTLLERFVEVDGTQTFKTKENWCLSMTSMNNDRRGVKANYQYSGQFYVLVAKTKDDKELLRIGFNTKDKRPAFPEGTPKPGPGPTPTPTPTPGPGPTPTPTPTPNPKDKSKGTQGEVVKPNDNPGPGPDTNNPKDPNHSSAEEKPNSTGETYSEYEQEMKDKEDINKKQNPTNPTTPADKGTNVVDPGAGSVNPKADTPPAETGDGKKIDNNNPGKPWGGPN